MPIFCDKHRVVGSLAYREGGTDKIKRKKAQKPISDEKRLEIEAKFQKRKEGNTILLKGFGFV
jgi:CRISPR/Cas system-associated endonuclease Cas1